jgi:hypothetical protein
LEVENHATAFRPPPWARFVSFAPVRVSGDYTAITSTEVDLWRALQDADPLETLYRHSI